MSVVVGVKDKDRVWLACDSQATHGYTKYTLSNKNNYKIFKPAKDNNTLIGVVGAFRDANILSCEEEYIDELTKLKEDVNFKYIVNKIVPKIIQILSNNKRISTKDDELLIMESMFLFTHKNKLFQIDQDGAVLEIDDYCAIGSGARLALGNLNKNLNKNKKQVIIDAVKSACDNDLYVNYPIIVMNTLDNEIEIVYEEDK